MPDLVIGFREALTALPTRAVIVCPLCVCLWVHVLVVGENGRYYSTFFYDAFIEFIHYLRSLYTTGRFGILGNY